MPAITLSASIFRRALALTVFLVTMSATADQCMYMVRPTPYLGSAGFLNELKYEVPASLPDVKKCKACLSYLQKTPIEKRTTWITRFDGTPVIEVTPENMEEYTVVLFVNPYPRKDDLLECFDRDPFNAETLSR